MTVLHSGKFSWDEIFMDFVVKKQLKKTRPYKLLPKHTMEQHIKTFSCLLSLDIMVIQLTNKECLFGSALFDIIITAALSFITALYPTYLSLISS